GAGDGRSVEGAGARPRRRYVQARLFLARDARRQGPVRPDARRGHSVRRSGREPRPGPHPRYSPRRPDELAWASCEYTGFAVQEGGDWGAGWGSVWEDVCAGVYGLGGVGRWLIPFTVTISGV